MFNIFSQLEHVASNKKANVLFSASCCFVLGLSLARPALGEVRGHGSVRLV
jgi:hypothetical protein